MSILATLLILSLLILAVIVHLVVHLPRPFRRLVLWIPPWLQAGILHFGYGTWVGGVLGHLMGGLVSLPYFFVCVFYIQPRLRKELVRERRSHAGRPWGRPLGSLARRLIGAPTSGGVPAEEF